MITWKDQWETKKYYIESRRTEISCIQWKWRLTGLVIPCAGVIAGKIERSTEVRERHGVRRKQLMDDLPENWKYWKLREEALLKRLWTSHKTDHRLNKWMSEWIWRSTNVALLKGQLTLQRGVTSTGRHSENITCRGVMSSARHGARSHSFVYISTT